MKKLVFAFILSSFAILVLPKLAFAAGVSVSGGSLKYPGDTSTVSITASGATFNAFQGTISSSGVVKITGCTAGSATWVTQPTGAGSFVGMVTSAVSSFRIATCSIKATAIGSGSVSVSGVDLDNNGSTVGTSGGSTGFDIVRQPTPPGAVTVTSSSHPDQNTAYEATTIILNWTAPVSTTTGYSYLLDQTADTTPPATVTNNNLTVTYPNEPIGTYYFHIRAKNGDGWGSATNFKITIKEPDPKIVATIAKPSNISIIKNSNFQNNITDGTVTNFTISGTTIANYMANIIFTPAITPPEGKILSVKADANGNFNFVVDFPFKAGNYTLTVQGQDNKTLTPVSDPVHFEISQSKGGTINILTASDTNVPVIPPKKWWQKIDYRIVAGIAGLLFLLSLAGNALLILKKRNK